MLDKINKWWNRKWSNWEILKEDYKYATLRRISNDGLIEYKTIRNY